MVLNYIWIAFFLISLAVGLVKLIFFHDTEVFTNMVNSTFEMAGVSVEICLGLIGVLTLWLGLMKVGEKGTPRAARSARHGDSSEGTSGMQTRVAVSGALARGAVTQP